MNEIIPVLIVGILAGVLSGLIGIGGGIIIVPGLVLALGMTQHKAQGTSIAALLLPIGIFAAWEYYKAGNVDFKVAMILAVTIAVFAYFGAMLANHLSPLAMRRIFAGVLVVVAVKLFLKK
jgi:uncharacterized protein